MGTANIVFGYAGGGTSRDDSPLLYPIESEALATSTSSAATTAAAPNRNEKGNRDVACRIILSEAGWVWVGQSPTANKTTTGIELAADTELYLGLQPGDKVAVLDDA